MVREIAVLIKRYFPPGVYSAVLEIYRRTQTPFFKKIIIDMPGAPLARVFRKYTYPQELMLFLTTRCNIRCLICRREDHQPLDMNFENIKTLREPISRAKIIDLTGWGEPFIYKNFDDVLYFIIRVNKRKNFIRITTNGTMLSERHGKILNGKIHSFTISLNASTEFTYNRDMKNSNFKKIIRNINLFTSALSKDSISRIKLHFVAHKNNYEEIPMFVDLSYSLGVKNISIGNYIISTEDHISLSLLNVQNEYNSIIDTSEKKAIERGIFFKARKFYTENEPEAFIEKCFFPYTQFFIMPDGEVSGPCCYSGLYPMGNVYRDGFEAIWFGQKYRKLRQKRHLPACSTCTAFSSFDSLSTHFDSAFLTSNLEKIQKQVGRNL